MASSSVVLSDAQKIVTAVQNALSAIAQETQTAIAAGATKTTIVISDLVAGATAIGNPEVSSIVVGGVELLEAGASFLSLVKGIL